MGFGPAGGGKTHSIQTILDEGFRPIVLACELGQSMGFMTLKHRRIPVVQVNTHDDYVLVMAELHKIPGKTSYAGEEFDFVILDSFTERGNRWLENFMVLKGWTEMFGVNTKGSGKDPRMAYSYAAEKGRKEMRLLLSCSAHVYVICRERTMHQGEGTDKLEWSAPDLPGQEMPRQMPGLPDGTVQLKRIAGKHVMITKGVGNTPSRVRLPGDFEPLPDRCIPNIGALAKYMCGERDAIERLRIPKKK